MILISRGSDAPVTSSSDVGLYNVTSPEPAAVPVLKIQGLELKTATVMVCGLCVHGIPGKAFSNVPLPWASLSSCACATKASPKAIFQPGLHVTVSGIVTEAP